MLLQLHLRLFTTHQQNSHNLYPRQSHTPTKHLTSRITHVLITGKGWNKVHCHPPPQNILNENNMSCTYNIITSKVNTNYSGSPYLKSAAHTKSFVIVIPAKIRQPSSKTRSNVRLAGCQIHFPIMRRVYNTQDITIISTDSVKMTTA